MREIEAVPPGVDARGAYEHALASLHLAPLPDVDHLGSDAPVWSLEELALNDALLAPGAPYVVLTARFDYGAFASAFRAAIFRVDSDGLCFVSSALSREIAGRSCLDEENPFIVRYIHLLSARYQTIELTVRSGRCDGYSVSRGALHELELWTLTDAAPEPGNAEVLVKLLGLTTFESWYTSPLPPLETAETKVEYRGELPRSVIADSEVSCDRRPEHPSDSICTESHSHVEYHYVNGAYQATRSGPGR